MSRKQKSLRAFLYQHPDGCAASYMAGWDAQKRLAHARTINRYRKALEEIVDFLRQNVGSEEILRNHVTTYQIAQRALDDDL